MTTVQTAQLVVAGSRFYDSCRGGGWAPPLSLEETVGYINRYLQQDFGDHVSVDYVDVDSADVERYPSLVEALKEGASIPLVLVGESVKAPAVLSFSWVVNEFRGLGVLE